jgi:beta-lactamase class A
MNMEVQQLLQTVKAAVSIYAFGLATHDEIISVDADLPFPAASTNKFPVALYTLHAVGEGRLSLTDVVDVRSNILQGSGVIKDLSPDHRYTVADLVHLMLILSDNTAAKALVVHLGVNEINNYLEGLGLQHTRLKVEAGEFVGWGMTSAKEQTDLLHKLYHGELLNKELREYLQETMQKCDAKSRLGRYVNIDPNRDGYIKVAYKGGTLPTVRNAVSWFYTDPPVAVCIFIKDLKSTPNEADEFTSKIIQMVIGGSDRMSP